MSFCELRFFLNFALPHWKYGIGGLFLGLSLTGLVAILPLNGKFLVDFVIQKEGIEQIEVVLTAWHLENWIGTVTHVLTSASGLIGLMMGIGLAIGLLGTLQRFIVFRFQQELTFDLQTTLFERILRFPISVFKEKSPGYLTARVAGDVQAVQTLFSQSFYQLFTDAFRLLFGLFILLSLSMKMTLMVIGLLPVYVFLNFVFSARIRKGSATERELQSHFLKGVYEAFSGAEVVKVFGREDTIDGKFRQDYRTLINTRYQNMILSSFSGSIGKGAQFLLSLVLIWFGVGEIQAEKMTIGDFFAFSAYVGYLSGPLSNFALLPLSLQSVFASLDRLRELFEMPMEDNELENMPSSEKLPEIHELAFSDVSFSYKPEEMVLRDVSFSLRRGEMLIITGPSGRGKTTLASLLLKFYVPQNGRISLNSMEIADLPASEVRKKIGYVSQDGFLFQDSIENNIRLGRAEATIEEIVAAAKRAQIHEYFVGLKDGYQTMVGDRGTTLSAGQRQRISIARAILKNPDILILDEPAAFLDEATERALMGALVEFCKSRITLLISHHPGANIGGHQKLQL